MAQQQVSPGLLVPPGVASLKQRSRVDRSGLLSLRVRSDAGGSGGTRSHGQHNHASVHQPPKEGRSRFLTELYRPLQLWLERTNTVLVASHLAGKLNKRADALSRWKRDRSDWRLNPRVFRRVDRMWGRHSLDLFATRLNAQLPRFVSWWHDPEAWATDAFLQDLRPENAYANPPFSMVARLLAMVRRQRATMTVIVPVWRTQLWWPMLAEMAVDCPLLFRPLHNLFLPGHLGSETPMGAPRWPALAVRISGATSKVAAFQRHLSECSVGRGAKPPTRATMVPGGSGFDG